jgi:ATP/maltotriose-dependent transcriptional regulator MalT
MMMAITDLKLLIFVQIGMDIAIVAVFIFLIKKLTTVNKDSSLKNGLKMFESVLADAEKTAAQFNKQLEEKKHLINKLNKQLDKKIMSINVLLNRADALLSDRLQGAAAQEHQVSSNQEKEIIKLAADGCDSETIADTLSISRGEVLLVLDLKKKIEKLGQEGAS